MRQEFSRKVMSAAFTRCNGHCEKCTAKLRPGKFAYDHILPDQLGGEPTIENCQVLCASCHAEKTFGSDIPAIRKSDRQRDKFRGATKRPTRGFPKREKPHSATRPVIHWMDRQEADND